jgi:hypothetical protein
VEIGVAVSASTNRRISAAASKALDDIKRAGANGVLIVTFSPDGTPEMTTNIMRESCMGLLRHMLDPGNAEAMFFPDDIGRTT